MQQYFFIRANGRYIKINFNEILFIEGCRNYTKLVTDSKTLLILITMKRMEQLLPINLFRRIHKSFIVSLERITEFDNSLVLVKDKQLPIGTQYKGILEKSVLIANDAMSEAMSPAAYLRMPMELNGKMIAAVV